MIVDLLLAADLIDAVANPSRTIEEHEAGAARLATLAIHGVGTELLAPEDAKTTDIDLLSGHVCRWALNEAKQTSDRELKSHLPQQEFLQGLFFSETDRIGRLLLTEAIVTHPDTEQKFEQFAEIRNPVPLEQLPNVWPRDYLLSLSSAEESEGTSHSERDVAELGMILLQIATPAALTLLGGTVMALSHRRREEHPLVQFLRTFVVGQDEGLARRLGLRSEPDRFA